MHDRLHGGAMNASNIGNVHVKSSHCHLLANKWALSPRKLSAAFPEFLEIRTDRMPSSYCCAVLVVRNAHHPFRTPTQAADNESVAWWIRFRNRAG